MGVFNELKIIPLHEFILRGGWGYELDRKKATRRNPVLTNGSCKLLIWKNKSNGHWLFKDVLSGFDKPFTGTIVDFLQAQGLTKKDILKHYGNVDAFKTYTTPIAKKYAPQPQKSYDEKHDAANELKKRILAFWQDDKNNYLKMRGISQTVLERYMVKKSVVAAKTNVYGAIFPLHLKLDERLDGKLVGMLRRNSKKDNYRPNAHYISGLRGFSILKPKCEFDKLYICESPIDALSLEALHTHHNVEGARAYLSTCGRVSAAQLADLKNILPHLKTKQPTLAFDNDEAGRDMANEVVSKLGIPLRVKFPKGVKDWNQLLKK